MIKLVIFDLDGTLLNTIDDISNSVNEMLESFFLPIYSVTEIQYMVGDGVDALIERAVNNRCDVNKAKEVYQNIYKRKQMDNTKPYPGIVNLLNILKTKSIKLAILSNKPHLDTENIINHYFGCKLFDYVLGKKANNRKKPSTDGINEILSNLSIKSDILYVGDTQTDILTAKRASIPSCIVTWGFRKKEELEDADYLVSSPEEILEIIEEIK